MNDLAYSLRTLLRHPRYTILAVVTLAAGIGVTSAMFGLLDALYFRPLPITEVHRLVDITLESPNSRFRRLSYEEFRDIERHVPGFTDVFAIGRRGVTLNHQGETHSLLINYVSGRHFPSLGIPMHLGRGLTAAEDDASATTPYVVINHHVWQELLGAPPDIIGRTIQLNSTAFTVIGVTARGFIGIDRRPPVRTDIWVSTEQAPLVVRGLRDELTNRKTRWFRVVGRLADGVERTQAAANLDVLAARWRADDAKEYDGAKLVVRRLAGDEPEERQRGAAFLAIVGLVLLIACANVANLTLARGEGRRREMALRSALGASRGVLVRQMLLESALVALAGAGLGLFVAAWIVQAMPALLPPGTSMIVLDVRVDASMLAFTGALTFLTTLLVGLLPAIRGSRASLTSGLKGEASAAGSRGIHLRDVLVVSEIALSGVIVIVAGLLLRSLGASLAIDPGFDMQKKVATFYMVPVLKGYTEARTYEFFERARTSVAALPGVTRVSYGIRLPAQGNEAGWAALFTIPGHQPPPGKDAFELRYTMVGPDYFEVLGTTILQGRGITDADLPATQPIAVISESMARRFWPGENPVGRTIRMGRARPVDRQIVGVAKDIRIGGLYEPPEPYVYVPFAQQTQGFALLLVETDMDTAALIAPVKQRLAGVDSNVPVLTVSSIEEHADRMLYEDRRNAWIGFAVAMLALALGGVGVYGVVALITARRTREMGIRVALGAERKDLLRLLLGRGVVMALAGAAFGVAGGLWAGRLLESQLHGVEPGDAVSLASATLVLVVVAIVASFTPAWRASHVDPVLALKDE